jgi:hypothetical protein
MLMWKSSSASGPRIGDPARDVGPPISALDDVAGVTEQARHQDVHEVADAARTGDAGDGVGKGEAGKRRNDHVVPVCG